MPAMSAEEFRLSLIELFGLKYRLPAAEAFGVLPGTIDRWATDEDQPNHRAVHPTAVKLLEALQEQRAARLSNRRAVKRYRSRKQAPQPEENP